MLKKEKSLNVNSSYTPGPISVKHVTLGIQVLLRFFKWCPWVDLDLFLGQGQIWENANT